MNTKAVGQNISDLMKARGISQQELADAIGVTESAISRWINGKRQPTVYSLLRLAQFFGVTMEFLMTGVDDEKGEGQKVVINVNEKWVIEVDLNGNYMPRKNLQRTETVKRKDGSEEERPVYGQPIGYYRNLENALNGIISREFETAVTQNNMPLTDAIALLQKIKENTVQLK